MSQELIIAIITGVTSLLLVFVGHKIEQVYSGRADKKNILEKQLFAVFEPLDKLLFEYPNIENEAFVEKVEAIVKSNYSLVPIKFLNVFTQIKIETSEEHVSSLKKCISANFNWIKRALRYPYDKDKILKSYIDNSLNPLVPSIAKIAFASLYFAIFMTFPSVQIWLTKIMETPAIFLINFLVIFGAFLFLIFLGWSGNKLINKVEHSFKSRRGHTEILNKVNTK